MTIYYTINTPQGEQLRNQAATGLSRAFDHGFDRLKKNLHDIDQMYYDLEHGLLNFTKKCSEFIKTCIGLVIIVGAILTKATTQGACDEDEASSCPTSIPEQIPTTTPSGPPNCPDFSNCGASSPIPPWFILPGSNVSPPTLTTPSPPTQATPSSPVLPTPSPSPNYHRRHTPI